MMIRKLIKILSISFLLLPSYSMIGEVAQSEQDSFENLLLKLEEKITVDPKGTLPEIKQLLKQAISEDNEHHQGLAFLTLTVFQAQLEQDEQSLISATSAGKIAIRIGDKSMLGKSLMFQALANARLTHYAEAVTLYETAIMVARENNLDEILASIYVLRARFHDDRANSEAALNDLSKALEVFTRLKDDNGLRVVLNGLAKVYSTLNQHDKSVEYHIKSLQLIDPEKDKMTFSISYFNIGTVYRNAGNLLMANEYFNKALQLSLELDDQIGIAYAKTNLGWVLLNQKSYEKAVDNYKQALPVFMENNTIRMLFSILADLADLEYQRGNIKKANDYTDQAQSYVQTIDTDVSRLRISSLYAQIYKSLGDLTQYSYYIEQQIDYQNKIHDEERKTSIDNLQMRFDIQQTKADNQLLKTEVALNNAELGKSKEQQKTLWLALGLAMILVLIFIIFLIQQIRIRKQFKRLAHKDVLTGAPNRRAIVEFGRRQFKMAKVTHNTFTIALMDLDKFKLLNDNYGHDTGDKVLIAFAAACKVCLRHQDQYGRYGGEEWLLVLPETDRTAIKDIFERLQEELTHINIPGLPAEHAVTFSLGSAQLNAKDKKFKDMIKRADEKLYQAKDAGRDCYIS